MKKVSNSLINWVNEFPLKKKTSHKYSRGHLVVLGAKKDMLGASILSCEAALRTGVGSVRVLCNKKTIPIYSLKFPSLLKTEINTLKSFKKFVIKNKKSVFLIGPGAGSNNQTKNKVIFLLKNVKYVILDADALTCFKKDRKKLYKLLNKDKIITPHIKEFNKIFPKFKKNKNIFSNIKKALELVNCTIVLKGSITYIAKKNFLCINDKSTNELAVIGSGDVLSGIISSLVGENKMNPFKASCAGVWIHSRAGKKSGKGLIAEDLIKQLKIILKKIYGKSTR